MSPQEIKALRIEVKKLLCDLELDRKRCIVLPPALEKYFSEKVSGQTLSYALTGARTSPPYVALLKKLRFILTNGEFINEVAAKNN